MAMRSWLFVPGDSQVKLDKVAGLGADVVIVDLEDAVAPPAKPTARMLREELPRDARQAVLAGGGLPAGCGSTRSTRRCGARTSRRSCPARPDGIMVPKAAGPEQLQVLAAELYELEGAAACRPGTTRILPLVSETPAAALGIASYAEPRCRASPG